MLCSWCKVGRATATYFAESGVWPTCARCATVVEPHLRSVSSEPIVVVDAPAPARRRPVEAELEAEIDLLEAEKEVLQHHVEDYTARLHNAYAQIEELLELVDQQAQFTIELNL